jgi:hypothetical protein
VYLCKKTINNYVNDILYGRKNLSRFTIEEHAGLCTAGEVLIGASIIASYAAASFAAGGNAAGSQEGSPANWEIDEVTARPICIDCIVKFVQNNR